MNFERWLSIPQYIWDHYVRWVAILRWWNMVRPVWPALGLAFLTPILLSFEISAQLQEIVYAALSFNLPSYYFGFSAALLFSFTLFLAIVFYTSEYYPYISGRAWRDFSRRRGVAIWIGYVPIFSLGALAFFRIWTRHSLVNFDDFVYFFKFLTGLITVTTQGDADNRLLLRSAIGLTLFYVAFIKAFDYITITYKTPYSEIPEFRWISVKGLLGGGALILVLSAFGIFCFWPLASTLAGSLAIYFVGLSFWVIILCAIESRLNRNHMPSTLVLISVVLAISAGVRAVEQQFDVHLWGAHNAIATVERPLQERRQTIDQHVERWLSDYISENSGIEAAAGTRSPPPIVVVIADGGGIRAAMHTSLVLNSLDQASCGEFGNRIFSLSSVSGGSLGVTTYLAARALDLKKYGPNTHRNCQPGTSHFGARTKEIEDYLTQDHFAPLLAGFFFLDPLTTALPIQNLPQSPPWLQIPDRAHLFEASLSGSDALGWTSGKSKRADDDLPTQMQVDVERGVRLAFPKRQPLVFLNTVRSNDGGLDAISNVTLTSQNDRERRNVLDRMTCDSDGRRSISLATAAVLSARFPFITPPASLDAASCEQDGRVKDHHRIRVRYVDGGYLDNSGAGSASDAVQTLQAVCASPKFRERCPKIVVLHIFARAIEFGAKVLDTSDDLAPELTAPPTVWLKSASVLARGPNEDLCRRVMAANQRAGSPQSSELQSLAKNQSSGQDCSDLYGLNTVLNNRISDNVVNVTANLSWVNAALDVGPPGDKRYVPLGWLLGRTGAYISKTVSGPRQEKICTTIQTELEGSWPCKGDTVKDGGVTAGTSH